MFYAFALVHMPRKSKQCASCGLETASGTLEIEGPADRVTNARRINKINVHIMKPVIAALFSVLTFASSASDAQTIASSFNGLSAAINLNFPTLSVNTSDALGNSAGNVSTAGQNLVVQVANGVAFGSNGVANFGFSVNLGDMKSASIGPMELTSMSTYALYSELGYALDTKSMAYGKVSLNKLTATVTGGGAGIDGALRANGLGYGVGYRRALWRGTYVQGELSQVNYGDVVSDAGLVFKPTSTNAMLGIGVKF